MKSFFFLWFSVSGITKEYVTLAIDNIFGGSGAEYTGKQFFFFFHQHSVKITCYYIYHELCTFRKERSLGVYSRGLCYEWFK